jgi:hypothetical protein
MSRHTSTYVATSPRGEHEVSGHGISVSCPTSAAARDEADRRNGVPAQENSAS